MCVCFLSDRQMLEECELQLQAQQQRCDADKERLEWLVKALSTVQAGVEHLADKLQHITLVNTTSDVRAVGLCFCHLFLLLVIFKGITFLCNIRSSSRLFHIYVLIQKLICEKKVAVQGQLRQTRNYNKSGKKLRNLVFN